MYGIMDPRQNFRFPPQQNPQVAQVPRETIGPSPATLNALDTPHQPQQPQQPGLMGYQSPSQGLFQAYMNQIFNQQYAPPVVQGPGSISQFNGYRGFGAPQMPMLQSRQQFPSGILQAGQPPGIWDWTRGGQEPGVPYRSPMSPVNNG